MAASAAILDALKRELVILRRDLARVTKSSLYLLAAVNACEDALAVVRSTVQGEGVDSKQLSLPEDPFGKSLEGDYDA